MKFTRSLSEALTGSMSEPKPPADTADAAAGMTLMNDQCIYLSADWWTYELCSGYHIRQFHVTSTKSLEQMSTLGESSPSDLRSRLYSGQPST